jgi:hypothetical protein
MLTAQTSSRCSDLSPLADAASIIRTHVPASVIAETHKNKLSVKETLLAGVDEPQNMMPETSPVAIKYR